jgi:hypothetical protein
LLLLLFFRFCINLCLIFVYKNGEGMSRARHLSS